MPNAISLFSGAGGMDIGMKDAGFDTKLCVEIDTACCDTLRKNLPHTKILNDDISTLSGKQILEDANIEFGDLDLLFGGPPCQSFSLAGNRHGLDDDRGKLVFDFIRLVKETAPKAFIMENVSAMASWQNGLVLKEINKAFSSQFTFGALTMQYEVKHQVLNAAEFGVPQNRKRIFIIGNRMGVDFHFPDATHGRDIPLVNVSSVLDTLPDACPPSKTALRVSQSIPARRVAHGY